MITLPSLLTAPRAHALAAEVAGKLAPHYMTPMTHDDRGVFSPARELRYMSGLSGGIMAYLLDCDSTLIDHYESGRRPCPPWRLLGHYAWCLLVVQHTRYPTPQGVTWDTYRPKTFGGKRLCPASKLVMSDRDLSRLARAVWREPGPDLFLPTGRLEAKRLASRQSWLDLTSAGVLVVASGLRDA